MVVHSPQRAVRVRSQGRAAAFLVVFVVAAMVGAWMVQRRGYNAGPRPESGNVAADFPAVAELPWPESAYLNARPGVGYVGAESCRDCHPEAFATYLKSGHSRSFRRTVPDEEPPDAKFVHALSRRRYEVYRDHSVLRHREVLLLPAGEELVSHDHAMAYTVGSGRFGRTCLAEVDGFLIQSPITWHAPRQKWDMSPGYESPQHMSFRRFVTDECLFCHSGHLARSDENPTRLLIHELAIGCERCHGPGALHVARHRSGHWTGTEKDLTIVNPGRLSQNLQEAVCAQCHLHSDADVLVRGRKMDDYRPGLPLEQFRVDFWLQEPSAEMSVVGHHVQLHQSRCYLASAEMSCLTCHDPHSDLPPDERVAHFRDACLNCHSPDECGVSRPERVRRAADDCTQCHMPRAATEVPHVAFTHHRIGIHSPATTGSPSLASRSAEGEFVPVDDPDLPDAEQIRLRGLAHFTQFRRRGEGRAGTYHHRKSQQLLNQALRSGAGDASVRSALADLAWEQHDAETASRLAQSVVTESTDASREWVDAVSVLAEVAFARQDFVRARAFYEQLSAARYDSRYWFFLGLCEQNCGDTDAAIRALVKSLEVDPVQTGAHDVLAILYQNRGDHSSEMAHRQASVSMQRYLRQFRTSIHERVDPLGLEPEQN